MSEGLSADRLVVVEKGACAIRIPILLYRSCVHGLLPTIIRELGNRGVEVTPQEIRHAVIDGLIEAGIIGNGYGNDLFWD